MEHQRSKAAIAAKNLFDIPELHEIILLQLDFRTLLFAQGVSKTWLTTVEESSKLQKKLFKRSVASFEECVALGMVKSEDVVLLHKTRAKSALLLHPIMLEFVHTTCLEVLRGVSTVFSLNNKIFSRIHAGVGGDESGSWRQMHLCQPADPRLQVHDYLRVSERYLGRQDPEYAPPNTTTRKIWHGTANMRVGELLCAVPQGPYMGYVNQLLLDRHAICYKWLRPETAWGGVEDDKIEFDVEEGDNGSEDGDEDDYSAALGRLFGGEDGGEDNEEHSG